MDRITLNRSQLEAVVSPLRMEILEWMQSVGPCSVAELGARMGRKPSTLHYHVNRLLKTGILVVSGTRRSGARVEAILATAAPEMVMRNPVGPAAAAAVRGAMAILRRTGREFKTARRHSRKRGPDSAPLGARMFSRLSPKDLERVRRHVSSLRTIFAKGRRNSADPFYSLTLFLNPVESHNG